MRKVKMRVRGAVAMLPAVLLIGTALPTTARAQEPRRLVQPDSIPVDLALALIASGGMPSSAQILPGAMPEWVTNKIFVPSGARVLGSMFLGTTAVGVVSVSEPPVLAMGAISKGLMTSGWKNPPAGPTMPGGGFRSAPSEVRGDSPTRTILCDGQQMLVASAAPQLGVGTIVTYRLSTISGYSQCRPQAVRAIMVISPAWPTLYNPPGTGDPLSVSRCADGMSGGFSNSGPLAVLSTTLTPEALLDHYGAQLADSGWKQVGGAPIAGRVWTRVDSTGSPVQASIVIRAFGGDPQCHEADLVVRKLPRP